MIRMIRFAVTISLVPEARGGPLVFWDDLEAGCRKAAELGFDAVEIFPADPDDIPSETVQPILDRYKLKVAAVGTGAGWVKHKLTLTNFDRANREQARTFVQQMIDAAGALGAPVIIGSMQGRWGGGVEREEAVYYLSEVLVGLGNYARQNYDVPLIYEPLNRYETNLFNRLGDTAAFLRTLRTRNVRLLADLFHMNIDEADSAAAPREAGALVGHVHFADSNRHAIGFGQTRVEPIVAALREIGYAGYLSAEIFPLPDAAAAARQTMAAFRQQVGA
jgi:sugar phosphate isomerase/epimerase